MKITAILALAFAATAIAQNTAVGDLADLEENIVKARAAAIQTPPEKRQLADETLVIARAAVQDDRFCGPGCYMMSGGCECLRKKEKRQLADLEETNLVEARAVAIQTPPEKRQLADENLVIARAAVQDGYGCGPGCFRASEGCVCLREKEKRELAGLEKKNVVEARDCPPSCFRAYGECYCGKKEKRELAGLEKKNVVEARDCPPSCFRAYGECYCGKKEKRELAGLEERNVVKARDIAPRLNTHCTRTCMRDINYSCAHCYQTPEPERRSADPEEKNLVKARAAAGRQLADKNLV